MTLAPNDTATQMPPSGPAGLSETNEAASNTGSTVSDGTQQLPAAQATTGRAPGGDRNRPDNQSLGSRLAFGLFGLLQNFVIIGVIVLVVVWLSRVCSRLSHLEPDRPSTTD